MNRSKLDVVVGAFVAGILVLGVGATWQTYRQAQAHGEMMGHPGTVHGLHPAWYLLGTLLVAGLVGGTYLVVREQLPAEYDTQTTDRSPESDDPTEANRDVTDAATGVSSKPQSMDEPESSSARARLLDVLPEDERRILEPVCESPGVTQIELRDRSQFSKSKVSQTVTDLEKRGLLYRERQGRTYRIYPGEDLEEP